MVWKSAGSRQETGNFLKLRSYSSCEVNPGDFPYQITSAKPARSLYFQKLFFSMPYPMGGECFLFSFLWRLLPLQVYHLHQSEGAEWGLRESEFLLLPLAETTGAHQWRRSMTRCGEVPRLWANRFVNLVSFRSTASLHSVWCHVAHFIVT